MCKLWDYVSMSYFFKSGSYLFRKEKINNVEDLSLIYSTAVACLVVSCIAQSVRPLNKPTYIPFVRNKGKLNYKYAFKLNINRFKI